MKRAVIYGRLFLLGSSSVNCILQYQLQKGLSGFRFAPSTLRNCVPQGAAHGAAAGHALATPTGLLHYKYYISIFRRFLYSLNISYLREMDIFLKSVISPLYLSLQRYRPQGYTTITPFTEMLTNKKRGTGINCGSSLFI